MKQEAIEKLFPNTLWLSNDDTQAKPEIKSRYSAQTNKQSSYGKNGNKESTETQRPDR